ncbi:MAG: hypothetical protein VYE73_01925 [Acidobacteriota bacterium]|nr:hypothetical protein [Acidobacteriota bacterium]
MPLHIPQELLSGGSESDPLTDADGMSPQAGPEMPRKRAIVLLRFALLIATLYLLLAQTGFIRPPLGLLVLAAVAFISNVAVMAVPSRTFLTKRFAVILMLVDTVWITLALVQSQQFDADFFFVYFFVLFLAGTGESLGLMALGAVAVSVGYLLVFSKSGDLSAIWGSSSLVRIPVLFTVACFYGYLVERVRVQKQLVRREGLENAELREGQIKLSE